jgi:hypothetical protein
VNIRNNRVVVFDTMVFRQGVGSFAALWMTRKEGWFFLF